MWNLRGFQAASPRLVKLLRNRPHFPIYQNTSIGLHTFPAIPGLFDELKKVRTFPGRIFRFNNLIMIISGKEGQNYINQLTNKYKLDTLRRDNYQLPGGNLNWTTTTTNQDIGVSQYNYDINGKAYYLEVLDNGEIPKLGLRLLAELTVDALSRGRNSSLSLEAEAIDNISHPGALSPIALEQYYTRFLGVKSTINRHQDSHDMSTKDFPNETAINNLLRR